MSEGIIFSARAGVGYIPSKQAKVIMEHDTPASASTTGTIAGQTATEGIKPAFWGDDNDFPGMIRKLLHKDSELLKLIDWCVRAAMGKGVVAFQEVDVKDDGTPVLQAIKDPAIRAFFNSPQTRMYLHEGFIDLFTLFNVYPELIPTKNRERIHGIYINEASHCRWALMGDDGKLKQVIHNKNWPAAKIDDPKQTTVLPAVDPYDYNLVESTRANSGLKKFIYPVCYPTIGQTYYQLAHWDGLRTSGWLEIAAKIPEFKLAMLKNQMTVKYLIRIPNHYWPSKYKNWKDLSDAERTKKKSETMDQISESLTDVDNAGKSILNEVGYDPVTKEKLPGWDIEVIDSKNKSGEYNEDSQEASALKMRALGLDNSLVGNLMTGKGMGAGSGSDKRMAYNIYMALIEPYRALLIDPLLFIARYNGWADAYPGFTLKFRDIFMETLDVNHQTSQPKIDGTVTEETDNGTD